MSIETTKPSKPWYKKWWVIVLAVLFVLGMIGSLLDDDTDEASPAPTPTVTETAVAPEPQPEPMQEPTTEEPPAEEATGDAPVETQPPADEPSDEQRLAAVEEALLVGTDMAPTWTLPITGMELRSDTLFVRYQESLADTEKVELGQYLHNFLRAAPEDLEIDTFVITDTSGIDFNVFCGKTICAGSIWDIDS
ncbi:hypothetical protein [Tessaracoccus massiliensis]|uniref:hypothetical protein n=1 Tax=Tessaracoccus massiliensis TaxID=1522311 RepID=UPI000693E9CE|nr:hypothetical protein [Tessaracoccus massiliensis]